MARFGRRYPLQSRLRKPAAIGPAVVFRAVKAWLADPKRPVELVTKRAPHSKLRPPMVIGAAVTSRPLKVGLSGTSLPRQLVTNRGAHSRLRAPTVVSVPAAPFMAAPIVVKTVPPLNRQAEASQRRAPTSRLSQPAVVSTAVTFGPVKVTVVRQPRRYQHVSYKLTPPTVVGPQVVAFTAAAIEARLAKRPLAFVRPKPVLRAPTVVDPLVTPTVPLSLRLKLAAQPSAFQRRTRYVLRPARAIAPPVTFRPVDVTFSQAISTVTDYRRRAPIYRLLPPTVTDTSVPPDPWLEAGFNAASSLEGAANADSMTGGFTATALLEGQQDESTMEAGFGSTGGLEA